MIILFKAWGPKGKWGLVTARRSWQNGVLHKADGQLVAMMRSEDQAFCLSPSQAVPASWMMSVSTEIHNHRITA